jgi:hypothetical protein
MFTSRSQDHAAIRIQITRSYRSESDCLSRYAGSVMTFNIPHVARFVGTAAVALLLAQAAPLGAQQLDPAATEALATTLKTLMNPAQRSAAIAGNPQATGIDQQVRSLTGSEALTEEFYALALDVFSELTQAAGGDITKMSEMLDRGKSDPAGLVAMLSPQTQERLRQFSTKISDQRK